MLAPAPLFEACLGLQFLTFMASGVSRYELDDEAMVRDVARPRLTTVILLKGRVWFVGSAGRWVHS